MAVISDLIQGTDSKEGLLDQIQAAIATQHDIDRDIISLAFDGNVDTSLNYRLLTTDLDVLGELGQSQIDVSAIEIAIARRIPPHTGGEEAARLRDEAQALVADMSCTAVDVMTNFRAEYISGRPLIARLIRQISVDLNPQIEYGLGRDMSGSNAWYQFAYISFVMPHCHC